MNRIEISRYRLDRELSDCLNPVAQLLNAVAEGRASGQLYTMAAKPTSVVGFGAGDFIANSAKAELGTTPNKYVIQGWDLVDISGVLTWLDRRTFTGN